MTAPQKTFKKWFGIDLLGDQTKPKKIEPEVAPDPDDLAAKRKAQREARRRSKGGRASTILTEGSNLG